MSEISEGGTTPGARPRAATGGRPGAPLFLVLDGVDGCGKSTQARRLVAALVEERGEPGPLHLREPGSTGGGERIRSVLLEPGVELEAGTEALLFAAARRQMLVELVAPALATGRDVVCERFHSSTFAYQGVAGGVDEEALLALLHGWAGDPAPDRVFLFDLAPEVAFARRGADTDRIEARGLAFQRAVADGFRRYAARFPETTVVIDAARSEEEVFAQLWREVSHAAR